VPGAQGSSDDRQRVVRRDAELQHPFGERGCRQLRLLVRRIPGGRDERAVPPARLDDLVAFEFAIGARDGVGCQAQFAGELAHRRQAGAGDERTVAHSRDDLRP